MRYFAVVIALSVFAAITSQPATAENRRPMFTCTQGAPAFPSGYQNLWDTVDRHEWGAADVSLSVEMPKRDGKMTRVWLYGDTLKSDAPWVHSSAITQVGGCIRVSRNGAQLLPDGDDGSIYWIDKAWRLEGTERVIRVKARSVILTGPGSMFGGWDDNGYWRYADVILQDDGDVVFDRWVRKEYMPPPPPAYFEVADDDPHHFYYSFRKHYELPSGQFLWTKCQNWDDGQLHGWDLSKPLFEAHPTGWKPGDDA